MTILQPHNANKYERFRLEDVSSQNVCIQGGTTDAFTCVRTTPKDQVNNSTARNTATVVRTFVCTKKTVVSKRIRLVEKIKGNPSASRKGIGCARCPMCRTYFQAEARTGSRHTVLCRYSTSVLFPGIR